MPGRWGDTPFLGLTACLILGITFSQAVSHYFYSWLLAANLLLIAASLLALHRSRDALAAALVLGAIALSGLLLALSQRDRISTKDLRALERVNAIPLGEMTMFDGCVTEDSLTRGGEILTTVDLHGFRSRTSWRPCRGKVLLRMPDNPIEEPQGASIRLRSGDRLRGWAELNVPRNFQNPGALDRVGMLMRRGIFLTGRVKSARLLEVIPGDCGSRWTSLIASVRNHLGAGAQLLKSEGKKQQAAVLESLLVGNYADLDSITRERFQNSGTYHVLVVSGLHVAWIAGVLLHILRLLRIPQGASRLMAACGLFFYSEVIGSQASISRCLWMFGMYLVGQALFRKSQPANIVLTSAFLLLVLRPDWLFDSSFQLSFLSVLAICLTALPLIDKCAALFEPLKHAGDADMLTLACGTAHRWGRHVRFHWEILAEALADRLGPFAQRLALNLARAAARASVAIIGMILISCSVQVWLEPVLAYHFNRLSWISPLANLVVVPLSSTVLAAGMIDAVTAQAVSPFHGITHAAGRLASLLLEITAWISNLPMAWQRCPTPSLLCVIAGIVLLCIWHFLRRPHSWIPWICVALTLVCLSRGVNPAEFLARQFPDASRTTADQVTAPALRLTFLDVGEGDSLVIRFPDLHVWILDAGGIHRAPDEDEVSSSFDIGESVVSRYLWHSWITGLGRVVLSHPDQDHAGGVPAVLKNFDVAEFAYGEIRADPALDRILRTARERRIAARLTGRSDMVVQGGVMIRQLNPPPGGVNRTTNDNSIVFHLEFGRFSALLTGDLEAPGETDILSHCEKFGALLLKVSHHGSRHGTTESFLSRVNPEWAVISVGSNNPFGHPAPEVLSRLMRQGSRPLATTDYGAVSFETDGIRYVIESHVCGVVEKGLLPSKMR